MDAPAAKDEYAEYDEDGTTNSQAESAATWIRKRRNVNRGIETTARRIVNPYLSGRDLERRLDKIREGMISAKRKQDLLGLEVEAKMIGNRRYTKSDRSGRHGLGIIGGASNGSISTPSSAKRGDMDTRSESAGHASGSTTSSAERSKSDAKTVSAGAAISSIEAALFEVTEVSQMSQAGSTRAEEASQTSLL